jgi:aminopeptidase
MAAYVPDTSILEAYAQVLVNYALGSGSGVKKGEVVQCIVPDVAKPIYVPLMTTLLKAGAQPVMRFLATGVDKEFFTLASDEQLTFFPQPYLKERVKLIDHSIAIIAETDLHELRGVDPGKIMRAAESKRPYRDWLNEKEYKGDFTWTLGLYGTRAMAREAGLTLEDYWQQIIAACYLDKADPIKEWRKVQKEQNRIMRELNKLEIETLHVKAYDTDLLITMGEKRQFVGGSGRNIPSFELFTSPDWRGTEGTIRFNQPLYRYGQLITDIWLRFARGKVVEFKAKKGKQLLAEMLKRPNADKVGEFSLTDRRFSKITKFMANTLYDENIGGRWGNTHIALGMSYKDAYVGDKSRLTKAKMRQLGFNDSGEHCDIISTLKRTVSATVKNGKKKIIYQDGQFTV